MISIKSQREIELMRQASLILVKAREALHQMIQPGITTEALDQRAHEIITSLGGVPAFLNYEGYPKSICTSLNEEVIHGIPSASRILKDGDIVSVDIGVKYQGYYADSAATFKVGTITKTIQQLLDVCEQALYVGIHMAKPGNRVSDISHAIESFVKPYGYGIVESFTGHGIGRSLHEEPQVLNYGKPNQGPILKPGMTICIEPMLNLKSKEVRILKDGWTVVTEDLKPSAHFEHMIVITESGNEILTEKKE
jgi:methionyl aminopeptidase